MCRFCGYDVEDTRAIENVMVTDAFCVSIGRKGSSSLIIDNVVNTQAGCHRICGGSQQSNSLLIIIVSTLLYTS